LISAGNLVIENPQAKQPLVGKLPIGSQIQVTKPPHRKLDLWSDCPGGETRDDRTPGFGPDLGSSSVRARSSVVSHPKCSEDSSPRTKIIQG
jgi:hypothetical protein